MTWPHWQLAVGSWQLAGANEKANKEEPTATTRTPPLQRCETRAIDLNRDTPSNPFVGGRERVGAPLGDVGQVPGGCVKPALRSLRWCASWRQSKQHEPVPLLQVLRYSMYSMYVPNADDSTGSAFRSCVQGDPCANQGVPGCGAVECCTVVFAYSALPRSRQAP